MKRKPKKNLAKKIQEKPKRVFFMDEARFGTHSKISHGWFKKGSRSRVKFKLGFKYFYVYSAVEPQTGEVFTLFLPRVNAENMSLFLEKLTQAYPDENITLVMDGAGWHRAKKLEIPRQIRPVYLPPYSPELNPVERLWLSLKRDTIRNKVYDSLDTLQHAVTLAVQSITRDKILSLCKVDWLL